MTVDVGDGLALGDLPDKHFAILGECDDRWGGASSFGVGDNSCFAAFEYCYAAIGGRFIPGQSGARLYQSPQGACLG